mmetsp:Transcript_59738/g.97563  ORF Transcript_59738/g.97563 Transcript_59738/m.97563 type:complete len:106 (-) Transcript_59738:8-325(-)
MILVWINMFGRFRIIPAGSSMTSKSHGKPMPEPHYRHQPMRNHDRDTNGNNQLTGAKPYKVKNDPGVDKYVWTVQDNSGWFEYDFEVSWKAYARATLPASAHAEP